MALSVADELHRAGVKSVEPFHRIDMPYPLRDIQVEGLNKSLRFDRFGLYLEPRLGKTPLFLMHAMYCAHYGVRTMILAPPITHNQIKEEWESFNGNQYILFLFNKDPAARRKLLSRWLNAPKTQPHVLVMTKDIFMKEATYLPRMRYSTITWDECHMGLQKSGTKIYGAIKKFLEPADRRLILSTGTPIYTSPMNCYPLISLTNPLAYQNEAAFERMHVQFKKIKVKAKRGFGRGGGSMLIDVPHKPLNLDLLHLSLYANAIRKTRIGNMDMKAPDIAIKTVSIKGKHYDLYNRFVRQKVLEVGGTLIKAASASKLRQVSAQMVLNPHKFSDDPAFKNFKSNAMFDMIKEITSQYHIDETFVLVAHYQESVRTLAEVYKDSNPCVVYGGNSPARNRQEADRFKQGKTKYLIMNADAGGVGLTLGKVCSNVIFVEPVSSYGKFDQTLSRVLLVDKTVPVTAYILKAEGTWWVRAVELMLDRTAQTREVSQTTDDLLQELIGK